MQRQIEKNLVTYDIFQFALFSILPCSNSNGITVVTKEAMVLYQIKESNLLMGIDPLVYYGNTLHHLLLRKY